MKAYLLPILFVLIISIIGCTEKRVLCQDCDGTGKVTCGVCDGTGESPYNPGHDCTSCKGTGEVECSNCDGTGEVTIDPWERMEVK